MPSTIPFPLHEDETFISKQKAIFWGDHKLLFHDGGTLWFTSQRLIFWKDKLLRKGELLLEIPLEEISYLETKGLGGWALVRGMDLWALLQEGLFIHRQNGREYVFSFIRGGDLKAWAESIRLTIEHTTAEEYLDSLPDYDLDADYDTTFL